MNGARSLSMHLAAASVLLGAFCLLAVIRRFFWEGWFEQHQKTRAPKFLSQIIGLIIFAVALLLVVGGIYRQSIQGAVFGSTVVIGVVGFAMQDLLGNIIAGVALELGKPFRTGDWLVVEGKHAEVIEVNWRSHAAAYDRRSLSRHPEQTHRRHHDYEPHLSHPQHALRFLVGFDYGVPPNTIKDLVKQATLEVKGVLSTPAPKVFLKDFADSAVMYEIKFWIEDETQLTDILDGHSDEYLVCRAAL